MTPKKNTARFCSKSKLPGIHFRLGRLLLSKPNLTPEAANEAKQQFVEELKIDPRNAGAEYVLGEMARQTQQWPDAVSHFSRAAKLDPQFGEAFLGLGMSLNAEKQYADAVAPLQTAVKLDRRIPTRTTTWRWRSRAQGTKKKAKRSLPFIKA